MDDMGGSSLQERMIAEQVRGIETSMVSYRGDLPEIEEHRFPGGFRKSWFRMLHRAEWAWHGISPVETEEVLSRIAASEAKRSRPGILDTVAQYGPGNWIYEFSSEAGKVLREANAAEERGGDPTALLLRAAHLYSTAAYPYLRRDNASEKALRQALGIYARATDVREISASEGGKTVRALLRFEKDRSQSPLVLVLPDLESCSVDFDPLYENYFRPAGLAMLTVDPPGCGMSAQFDLTEDCSLVCRLILDALRDEPAVDTRRISVFALRFGGNIALRLCAMKPGIFSHMCLVSPPADYIFTNAEAQEMIPGMLRAVFMNRLGRESVWPAAAAKSRMFSLSLQGVFRAGIHVPIQIIGMKGDPIVPESDISKVSDAAEISDVILLERGKMAAMLDEAVRSAVDWYLR